MSNTQATCVSLITKVFAYISLLILQAGHTNNVLICLASPGILGALCSTMQEADQGQLFAVGYNVTVYFNNPLCKNNDKDPVKYETHLCAHIHKNRSTLKSENPQNRKFHKGKRNLKHTIPFPKRYVT